MEKFIMATNIQILSNKLNKNVQSLKEETLLKATKLFLNKRKGIVFSDKTTQHHKDVNVTKSQ